MQLKPQQNFAVIRQIANHLDTDTNYVQAVIRNASTDVILATIQLTDKGNQRFIKNWTVPADTSGQGFYLSIVTSVYTDSGYTTKNPTYGDEEHTYLVADLMNVHRGFAGGRGADAGDVRRIIREELAKIKEETPSEDTSDEREELKQTMMDCMAEMRTMVEDCMQTTDEKSGEVDKKMETMHQEMLGKMKSTLEAIEAKEVTPPTDIEPLNGNLQEIKQTINADFVNFMNNVKELTTSIPEAVTQQIMSKLNEIMQNMEFKLAPGTAKMSMPKPTEPASPQIDLSKLTQ